jgi:hypothetical protein
MVRRVIGIAAMAAMLAGCCKPRLEAPRWSRVAYSHAEFSLPPGWFVRIGQRPMPVLDLYAPDPQLAVFALPTSAADAQRQADDLGVDPGIILLPVREGLLYGEKAVEPGRVFAACAVIRTDIGSVLAVARLMDRGSVSTAAFEAAGGRTLLCEIASSIAFKSEVLGR